MTIETPTLDQVLSLAQRLDAADKLRLIAQLALELATALPEDADDDAWNALLRSSDEIALLPPLSQDSAEVLSAMRQ
jgi:hypothetical protein